MTAVSEGQRYDPQFTYQRKAELVKESWTKYSNVHREFFDIAVSVLEKVAKQFPNMQDYFDTLYGTEKTSNEDLVAALKLYLREHGVEDAVEKKIGEQNFVFFSEMRAKNPYYNPKTLKNHAKILILY